MLFWGGLWLSWGAAEGQEGSAISQVHLQSPSDTAITFPCCREELLQLGRGAFKAAGHAQDQGVLRGVRPTPP